MLLERMLDSPQKIRLLGKVLDNKYYFSVSELSRLSDLPKATVSRIVKDWENAGIVEIRHEGRNKLVEINKKFYLLPELEKIFRKTANFQAPLIAKVKRITMHNQKIKAVVISGSRARQDYSHGSDLDILLCVQKRGIGEEKVQEELFTAGTKIGVMFSAIIFDSGEVRSRLVEKDQFILNILRQGKILKGGKWLGDIQAALGPRKREV